MRTCVCYLEIERPHGKEGKARFVNEGTFAFCLYSFWISLWTSECEVCEGAFCIFLILS